MNPILSKNVLLESVSSGVLSGQVDLRVGRTEQPYEIVQHERDFQNVFVQSQGMKCMVPFLQITLLRE